MSSGPDIPERLLQAHEDGRVVFFCGAGISFPAGLPGYGGLVGEVYSRLGVTPNAVQQAAMRAGQYDIAMGLLEAECVDGRLAVRKELAAVLTSADTSPRATETQEALLTLGRCRNGRLRLVTTNFDRLFQAAIVRGGLQVTAFQAPFLPVPKDRWDGLIYLHGLLPPEGSGKELDHLVVSSGDFGLAYLTERWAAHFVSEMFRRFTVCFVGYSLSDPVLRYMMDALAADRERGESPLEMFAFGCCSKGKERTRDAEWRARNVTPILYQETKRHQYLQGTLRRWAEVYRDGVRGKEQIVIREATASPLDTTREDDFVGRVVWALSDPSGMPARRFADMDPVPSLHWLKPLSQKRYGHDDLACFGVASEPTQRNVLAYSLVRRPAPLHLAPPMALVDAGSSRARWDNVMFHLARWLTRHLDDPQLVLWLASGGGHLEAQFAGLVHDRLNELSRLERAGKSDELDRIRSHAPRAVPRPTLRAVWRVLLSGRIKSPAHELALPLWLERLKSDGLTPSLRLALRELLTPCVELKEPFGPDSSADKDRDPLRLEQLVDWELKLRADHVHSALREVACSPAWQTVLPSLLPELTLLLRDALDLAAELGGADGRTDSSYVHQPSISVHPQNRELHDWTALIDLTRDAWLQLSRSGHEQAKLAALQWQGVPYPLFRRLAFFAAAQGGAIPPQLGLDWLLADGGWWLWSVMTQREALRLLVALAPRLDPAGLGRLEAAILAGPPRAMFRDGLPQDRWAGISDHGVWLRLAKAANAGAPLGTEARSRLSGLSHQNTGWRLAPDERDEFPFWLGHGDEFRSFVATPRRRRELLAFLEGSPEADDWQEDDWRERCRGEFATTACALRRLSRRGVWPTGRWREALQAWAEADLAKRAWQHMAPVLGRMPDTEVAAIAHSLSWWLQAVAESCVGRDDLFLGLSLRILEMDHQEYLDADEAVAQAINHPVGLVTDALLTWWSRSRPADNQGLTGGLRPLFTRLCSRQVPGYRHARVLLASRVVALFRTDASWTKAHLLPLFDWQASTDEARAAWEGFLLSPRLYRPLFEVLKDAFLDTAAHCQHLPDRGRRYAALLAFAALEPADVFTTAELRAATDALTEEGRTEVVETLTRALGSAGEQRSEFWRNQVRPFLRLVWPKAREYRTQALSEGFAQLCIAANDQFPEALDALRPWLQPIDYPGSVVEPLNEAGLAARFPADALQFLDAVVGDGLQWLPRGLSRSLDDIRAADPSLGQDERFRRLAELLRRQGRD